MRLVVDIVVDPVQASSGSDVADLRATACKYGESSDRTKILVFVLFHRKHPFGELLSKIVLKNSIARLFL